MVQLLDYAEAKGMTEKEFSDLVSEYADRFNENFPVFLLGGDDDLVELVKDCLAKNKPYEVETVEGVLY